MNDYVEISNFKSFKTGCLYFLSGHWGTYGILVQIRQEPKTKKHILCLLTDKGFKFYRQHAGESEADFNQSALVDIKEFQKKETI